MSDTDFTTYKQLRRDGFSGSALVAWFGPRDAAAFELQYQQERAEGIVSQSFHDDAAPCSVCGRKYCGCPKGSGFGPVDRNTRMDK